MLQRINKRILFYSIVFIIFSSFNNKNLLELTFFKNNNIEIIILNESINNKIKDNVSVFKNHNLFLLQKDLIFEILDSDKTIEKIFMFKNYPSRLIIDIKKTKFLAMTKKNGIDYYIGSNGKLINVDNTINDLPFIFGDLEISDFFRLKKIINKSNFNFSEIKNLYYFKSRRWDIETKDDLLIKLPYKNLDKSFEILSKILNEKSFDNKEKIYQIDLRQKNQVIIDE